MKSRALLVATLLAAITTTARAQVSFKGTLHVGGVLQITSTNNLPTILSVSPTSGCPGDGVELIGINLGTVTAVNLNGVSAVFSINSSTQITATVPNNVTSGQWNVTSPAGSGTSAPFTVGACGFAFSFTSCMSSVPSGVAFVRTGNNIYAQNGASTVQAWTAATGYVCEDLGDGGGPGLWSMAAHVNQTDYTNFSNAVYTNAGLTVTSGVADPAGGTAASNVQTTVTGTCGTLAAGPNGPLDQIDDIASVWYKNGSPSPTPNPGFVGITGGGPAFAPTTSTTQWTRQFVDFHKVNFGNRGNFILLSPCSYAYPCTTPGGCTSISPVCDNTVAGGADFWGAQTTIAPDFGITPVVVSSGGAGGSSGAATIQITGNLANSITNNDMHLKGCYLADRYFQAVPAGLTSASPRLWSMQTADGESTIIWNSQSEMTITLNGDNAGATGVNIGSQLQGTLRPTLNCWEWWSQPSVSTSGFQFIVNGFRSVGSSVALSSVYTMHVPTQMWLGSDLGNGADAMLAARWTALKASAIDPNTVEGYMAGDSLISLFSGFTAVGSWTYTVAQALSRPGIFSSAFPGETIQQQQARFDASPQKGQSYVKWFFLVLGNNNMSPAGGQTDAQSAAALQAFINDIHASNPTAKIIVAPNFPTQCAYPSTNQRYFYNYDQDVLGAPGAPNPILDPGGGVLLRMPLWTTLSLGTPIAPTTLAAPMGAADTSASVATTAGMTAPGTVTIDSESITYTGLSGGNTITGLGRGANGTSAASHLLAAVVNDDLYCWQSQLSASNIWTDPHENDVARQPIGQVLIANFLTANGLLN